MRMKRMVSLLLVIVMTASMFIFSVPAQATVSEYSGNSSVNMKNTQYNICYSRSFYMLGKESLRTNCNKADKSIKEINTNDELICCGTYKCGQSVSCWQGSAGGSSSSTIWVLARIVKDNKLYLGWIPLAWLSTQPLGPK